jgi:hypothetical protein
VCLPQRLQLAFVSNHTQSASANERSNDLLQNLADERILSCQLFAANRWRDVLIYAEVLGFSFVHDSHFRVCVFCRIFVLTAISHVLLGRGRYRVDNELINGRIVRHWAFISHQRTSAGSAALTLIVQLVRQQCGPSDMKELCSYWIWPLQGMIIISVNIG